MQMVRDILVHCRLMKLARTALCLSKFKAQLLLCYQYTKLDIVSTWYFSL